MDNTSDSTVPAQASPGMLLRAASRTMRAASESASFDTTSVATAAATEPGLQPNLLTSLETVLALKEAAAAKNAEMVRLRTELKATQAALDAVLASTSWRFLCACSPRL
jgi:hypothetical protein